MNYKGMDKNMQCKGFQYELGGEYEHTGPLKCCPSTEEAGHGFGGFHACKYPLDVFNYYPPAHSRFFEVEQSGLMEESGKDTKVASTKIKIGAEIGIAGLVKASIKYIKERTTELPGCHATGDQGAASATGNASVALATGIDGSAMGALGCAICVVERGEWDGKTYPIKAIKAAIVDGKTIKPGVFYRLVNGEFVENC